MGAQFELGQLVTIKPPFGDGVTSFPVTSVVGVTSEGVEGEPAAFYQYEVDGAYYAEEYIQGAV